MRQEIAPPNSAKILLSLSDVKMMRVGRNTVGFLKNSVISGRQKRFRPELSDGDCIPPEYYS
jgi:hypothetical protein